MSTNARTRFSFSTAVRPALLGATSLLLAALLGACGDDEPTAPPVDPNLGKKATVVVFHALSDAPGPISFTVGDTTVIADTVPYGTPRRASAQIGTDVRVTTKSTAGQSIGLTRTPIATDRLTWVIFTGFTFGDPARELISVTTGRPTASASRAMVRMINASPNGGTVDLRIADASGPKVATGLAFKQTGEFITVDTTTTQLVVTASTGGAQIAALPVTLAAGKMYTVIFYGSSLATGGDFGLRAQIVEEP